ncbi:tyrosine-type recombinase/integrase [Kitasatospora sp. LaBMicrA B282]|uniref:tyrosine-type recombinase/integrase n=1 Tax=Kitasatospora sp. LaBMicrA B282 TaxID=3420949 RepID=UPI003D0D498C
MNLQDHHPGAAHLMLLDGVVHLDPEPAVLRAMLDGWARQQRVRYLKADTIGRRESLVNRLVTFSNQYPWQWTAPEVEAFFDQLRWRGQRIAVSTTRGYQGHVRLFLEFITDPRYGWPAVCRDRFGAVPQQLLDERNTVAHVGEYEGDPRRRPFTYDEVQQLFDAADQRVEDIRRRGRKGALAAQRDSALMKMVYAFGLRRSDAWGLDLADLRSNPKMRQFGRLGLIHVRWGKSSRGAPPKRRTVYLVPEMDWVMPVLTQWVDHLRAAFSPGAHPALWVTERRGRLSCRRMDEVFVEIRKLAGLDPLLDLHCLRHSYITHLIEFGYPERFVQDQVGHRYGSTTAVYTGVSPEYRNRLLTCALRDQHADLWGPSA